MTEVEQLHANEPKENNMSGTYIPSDADIGDYIALLFNKDGRPVHSMSSPDMDDFTEDLASITEADGTYIIMKIIQNDLGRTLH